MLEQLLAHEHVAIQCHDNPDADSIASAFGLYSYFKAQGKRVVMFHGGRNPVSKPNLVKMLALLHIPLEHFPEERAWPGLLITADCQYGAGNVAPMSADEVAVIDHHIMERKPPGLYDIRPFLGSCSTLVWTLLRRAGFEPDTALSTALYYGLFTDTGGLSEVRHPLDRDLRDSLAVSGRIMRILKNSNLSREDLALASTALNEFNFYEQGRFALVSSKTGDPNILGFISDLIMQVDDVDIGVVYSLIGDGVKYSVRTVVPEYKASEIAAWFAVNNLGSGGGHADKAGGWLSLQKFEAAYPGLGLESFFSGRLAEYLAAYTVLDVNRPGLNAWSVANLEEAALYEKLPVSLAYVPCAELLQGRKSASLHIRMLEGDINIEADESTYLMIGLEGEVYPISRYKFESSYTDSGLDVIMNFEYPPAVLLKDKGERVELYRLARSCRSREGGEALAAPLERGVKLFTRWDSESYIKGEAGDWLIWTEGDPLDMYIVTARMFTRLYRPSGRDPGALALEDDYSGRPVADLPGARRVRKLPRRFSVRFAPTDGLIHTLEGAVPYARGDAIVLGPSGEAWPVPPGHFQAAYSPAEGTGKGMDGFYLSQPLEAFGAKIEKPFRVAIGGGAFLHGQAGDWLLEYAAGGHGIVSEALFPQFYELVE